jgi:pseudaminic acid synthase|tara:strand:+ start:1793 stop:2815 length:1023 start_codon:yes stop_codon:yes gene_type:complete
MIDLFNNKKPILIAEISCNHNGSIKKAKKLITLAKKSGADVVKLQTYTPDTMTIKSKRKNFVIKNGLWKGKNLWALYNKSQTPFEWQKTLFSHAKKIRIVCFSTPFDETAVDLLEKLRCPFYKISSFEMNDLPLIKKVAKTKKPLIISTGTSSLNEITKAYNAAKNYGVRKIILLYCVSNYPAKIEDFNLNNIRILKEKFKCPVGLSDHSKDSNVMISALSIGAMIFEKHIALENQKKGFDIEFSLKGKEIKEFKNMMDKTWNLIGPKKFIRKKTENSGKFFRRSIYVVKDIKKGEYFTKYNIRRIRPGDGLEPSYYEKVLGKKSKKFLKRGEPFKKSFY